MAVVEENGKSIVCLSVCKQQENERFWKRYESHGAHWQEQSGSARFTGERPAFCAMSPKWHHLKITGRTSSFCSQYFICQKLVNAVYNMQKTSASDTKQAPHWPCICLSQVTKLNLPASAAVCNHCYSWFLSNSSESETENANRHPRDTQSGEHMLEHQGASPIFLPVVQNVNWRILYGFIAVCCSCRICTNSFTPQLRGTNPETPSTISS